MSELNVYHHELRPDEYDEFYLKYEADKVIAEQKDKLQNVSSILNQTREWLVESQKLHKRCADNAVKVIRHNKYKRCLAMAKYCEAMRGHYLSYEEPKWFWYRKWAMRWMELAEKFKHNSTAQQGKGKQNE